MIQLTTNYQKVAEAYVGNTGYADVYIRAYIKLNSQNIPQNTSSINYKSTLYFGNGSFYASSTTTKSLAGNGAEPSVLNGIGTYYAGETTLNEITGTVTHDDQGNYTTGISATFVSTPWGWNATATGTAIVPIIPRYATANQSLNNKTETTVKMNWSSDNTIDYIWYSVNNGSTWTGIDITDGTSGNYTITGLKPNTTYNIKTRVRRKDSQLTTDSNPLSVTTYKAPTQSLNSATETTIKMNYSIDSTTDYLWYSKDNGSTWSGVDIPDGTSGSYTISGLSANTKYNIKTRLRRKATQTTYDTSALAVTTYDYPHITKVETANLIIENSQKLTLYNPLSRSVTIKMHQNSISGTQLYSGNTSSTSLTFNPDASTLYSSIPNVKSSKCVYSCTYSSVTKSTSDSYTYVIDESACKPTFSNFTYVDTDSTIQSVVGNNQILVNNNSDCKFTISVANKAVAKNSASIVKYICYYGTKSSEVEYSSTTDVSTSVYDSTGNALKVTAVDSRGLSTTVTKTVTYVAYTSAVVNSLEVQRLNGVDLETYLGLKMTIWKGNWQNGSDTNYDNQLKYVGYRVYDGSTWTSYFDITSSVKSAMSTSTSDSSTVITIPLSEKLAIHANGSNGGFIVGKEYKIQVLIKDGTSTATFTPYSYQATAQGAVPDGKVGFSRYKDSDGNYHYAINGMPESDTAQTIYGDLRVLQGEYDEPKVSISSGKYELDFLIGASGANRGIYDRTNSKWLCYLNSSNKGVFVGNADTATTAAKLGTYVTLTSNAGNTNGWRLVTTKTFGTWAQGRWLFSVSSRHNGNGILAISLDTNNTLGSWSYNVKYSGATTGLQTDVAWKMFYNSSTGVFRLYYYFNDYSPCIVNPLIDGSSNPTNGTWYTTLPNDNGTELKIQYNVADSLSTSAGSEKQPIYFSNGKPVACTYALGDACTKGVSSSPANGGGQLLTNGGAYTSLRSLIKYKSFSKKVTISANANGAVSLGTLSTPNGYTFIGILPLENGYGDQWLVTYSLYGGAVYAYYKSWYGASLTGTLRCTAIFINTSYITSA